MAPRTSVPILLLSFLGSGTTGSLAQWLLAPGNPSPFVETYDAGCATSAAVAAIFAAAQQGRHDHGV
jgi:hypothetical protein